MQVNYVCVKLIYTIGKYIDSEGKLFFTIKKFDMHNWKVYFTAYGNLLSPLKA